MARVINCNMAVARILNGRVRRRTAIAGPLDRLQRELVGVCLSRATRQDDLFNSAQVLHDI